jgi:molybdate transport repressor ModE-like protein
MDLLREPKRVLILREVVQAGSISAGARALGWTQPAVTQHLNALERVVGMPLLLRQPSGVTPTEAGKALLHHADAIAGHMDAAGEELVELLHLARGRLRIASFSSGLATVVSRAIEVLNDQVGDAFEFALQEAEPTEALQQLREGAVDIALVFDYPEEAMQADDLSSCEAVTITEDPISLVLPAGHPVARVKNCRLKDLADEAWVSGRLSGREHLLACCRAAGFEPRIQHNVDDIVVVQTLVSQGLAIATLPSAALTLFRSAGVAIVPNTQLGSRRTQAVYRAGADRVPSVRAALSALAQQKTE